MHGNLALQTVMAAPGTHTSCLVGMEEQHRLQYLGGGEQIHSEEWGRVRGRLLQSLLSLLPSSCKRKTGKIDALNPLPLLKEAWSALSAWLQSIHGFPEFLGQASIMMSHSKTLLRCLPGAGIITTSWLDTASNAKQILFSKCKPYWMWFCNSIFPVRWPDV